MKIIIVFVNILLVISLCCCVPVEIILPGDISGYVTDTETSQPVQQAAIRLNPSNDSTVTEDDGSYLLKNLDEGDYEIKASKPGYIREKKNVHVNPATTANIDFNFIGAPNAQYSHTYLDFGLESIVKSFTITNVGSGTVKYSLIWEKGWIDIEPSDGEVTTGTDTIIVTVDKTNLPESKLEESINIIYYVGEDQQQDQIDVYLNGVIGLLEEQYYSVIRIGNQVWMAENLNTGRMINFPGVSEPEVNDIVEKYCYDNI